MKPEARSELLLGITRSKAKMFEYRVPDKYHIEISRDPSRLFPISIGLLGDLASAINRGEQASDFQSSLQEEVRFSAHFFDAFIQGKFEVSLDSYLLVVGAAAYYLCDLPGSAAVLAKKIPNELGGVDGEGLEDLVAWLLKGDFSEAVRVSVDNSYYTQAVTISKWMSAYMRSGREVSSLGESIFELRTQVYRNGTARQLLLADIVGAIATRRHLFSTWYSLPLYSKQPLLSWVNALRKPTFLKELWPAQRLLGEKGLLQGTSGVIQMPTSAGKSRSAELIIRSEFLAGRAKLAVIVAPFKALCNEIRDAMLKSFEGEDVEIEALSDVYQNDFELEESNTTRRVLVATPEKLVYILRQTPELAESIGLLVYDEGHQFDNGSRGVTYELLVTCLKSLTPKDIQTILISAVMTNAEAINAWLNGANSVVVDGSRLNPTFRSIAFVSWTTQLGRLEFVRLSDPDTRDFFVPRIIESTILGRKPRESKTRVLPEKNNTASISVYLSLKLAPEGCVAVFCGKKTTVTAILEYVADTFDRSPPFEPPAAHSDADEIRRLFLLHQSNLGSSSPATKCSAIGVFGHHGSTPHGLRMAIEHAMRVGMARVVICTSTLAQGVNLPIRYLIVNSTRQGSDSISVRDFHNLLGRAGRSGMHTEGSIIFADHNLYDSRTKRAERWRWLQMKQLLKPSNSEPCVSALLAFFDPLKSDDRKYQISIDPALLIDVLTRPQSQIDNFTDQIFKRNGKNGFSQEGLFYQLEVRRRVITAIESYLMTYWQEDDPLTDVEDLAKRTLGFSLAKDNPQQQSALINLFVILADGISRQVPELERRKRFGKTLYGLQEAILVESWVRSNSERLLSATDSDSMLDVVWPLLSKLIRNSTFQKCTSQVALKACVRQWINGEPFYTLLENLIRLDTRFGRGTRPRKPTVETVVDLCESGYAFDGMLAVGAIAELFDEQFPEESNTVEILRLLQKRMKYGLASKQQIDAYELGFCDRVVAKQIAAVSDNILTTMKDAIRGRRDEAEAVIVNYPIYFHEVLNRVLN